MIFPRERVVAGLDIGASAIKVVKLKACAEGITLVDVISEPAGENIAASLKKIAEAGNLDTVNTAVSGPDTVIRNIDFPKLRKDELSQALKFEAQEHIPFSVEDVNMDAYILRDDLPGNKMRVLIAAAKKTVVQQRIELMAAAGIKPGMISLDSIALINAFNRSRAGSAGNKTAALLHIGAAQTNLNIMEGESPVLSRDIHIAGNDFTMAVADDLRSNFNTAEELKINPTEEKKDRISRSVESVLASIVNEVRVSFDFYESSCASTVTEIFIGGGGSRLFCLKDSLADMLGMKVEYWDPLKSIIVPDNPAQKDARGLSAQLAVAAGLALSE